MSCKTNSTRGCREDTEEAVGRDEWSMLPGHEIGLGHLGHLSDFERLKSSPVMLLASQVQLKVGYIAYLNIPL